MEPTINKVLDKLNGLPEYAPLIAGRLRKYDRRHYFDDSKVESHFAIIPTDNIPKGLTGKDAKVYDMICRSVIRMLYGSAKLEQTKILTVVAGEEFVSSGNVIVEPGWMAVGDSAKEDILPAVKVGDELPGTYTLSEKKTKPPTRYNDKDLLAAMLSAGKTIDDADLRKILSDPKTGGIGTEATRAAIVETLVKREYIKREAKAIAATEKGIRLIENLPLEAVKSAEMTARWEKRLNDIARGIEDPDHFRKDIEGALPAWIAEVNSKVATMAMAGKGANTLGVDCPVCGKPMTINKWGYGCSGWRDGCKFGIGVICGKKLTENQARILVTKKKTPLIKGFTSKAGKSFDAYLVLDGKDIKFEFPPR
jgi:DNA topoisomerase-3